jgi:hypothetical protein
LEIYQRIERRQTMGRIVAVVAVAIVITLGMLVGTRLSADSIALIVGVLIGITASIPTGFLFAWALSRRNGDQVAGAGTQRVGQMGNGQYPPVIVVNPGTGMPAWQPQPQAPVSLPGPTGGRRYDVVGEIAEEGSYASEL